MGQQDLSDLDKANRAQALVNDIDSPAGGLRERADEILDDLVAELLEPE